MAPSRAGLWTTLSLPSPAPVPRVSSNRPHPTRPASRQSPAPTPRLPSSRARLIVPGPATRGPVGPRRVQLHAQPLLGAQAQAGQPAPQGLLRPQAEPSARQPKEGSLGKGPNCLLRTKAPARGQEDAVVRSRLPGLLSEQNQRGSRAAPVRPGKAPCARDPGGGRAKPGGSSRTSATRCAPGRAAPRHPRPEERDRTGQPGPGARRGLRAARSARHLRAARRRQQGVRSVPSGPLAPFLSALLAGPPAPSLPARTPRARPLRPALPPSELEPVAAAPGFPQCTARRSSHPIPSARVRPPLPRRPGLDPNLAATRAAALLAPPPDVGRSVPGCTEGLASGPLPSGTARQRWTPDAVPRSRDALAEVLLQRTSQAVRLRWPLLSAYCVPGPQQGTCAASSLESFPLTQRRRHNCCYHFSLPSQRKPSAHRRAPSSPPLSLDKGPRNSLFLHQLTILLHRDH